jgi:excisionase family DNA binding protein
MNDEVCYIESSSLKTEYREWLTSAEAAHYLGIGKPQLMNLTSCGRVPYFKFGRSNRYLISELRELLMSQPRGDRHGNQI